MSVIAKSAKILFTAFLLLIMMSAGIGSVSAAENLQLTGLPESGTMTVGDDPIELCLFDAELNEIEIYGNVTIDDESLATITGSVFLALKAGTVTVYADYAGNTSAQKTITINPAPVDTVIVNPHSNITNGSAAVTFSAQAYARGTENTTTRFTWNVDNGGVIDSDGKFTPAKTGTFIVTATADNGISNSTSVLVVEPKVVIEIIGPSLIQVGQKTTLRAYGVAEDGEEIVVSGVSLTYNDTVISASPDGENYKLTALADGSTEITAICNGIESNAVTLAVGTPVPIFEIDGPATVSVGESNLYSVIASDDSAEINSYEWKVNTTLVDISSSTENKTNIVFHQRGVYQLSVVATNTTYGPTTKTLNVEVKSELFNVNIDSGIQHGSLAPSSATAYEGDIVTITAHPAGGYSLSTLTVTKKGTTESVATTGSGNTRTFTMPDICVNVTATFTSNGGGGGGSGGSSGGGSSVTPSKTYSTGSTAGITAIVLSSGSAAQITCTEGSSVPALPSSATIYKTYEITGPSSVSATFSFSIPVSDLTKKGFGVLDVSLMHYKNGAWTYESTKYLGTVNGIAKYSATVSGFSPFAVAFAEGKAVNAEGTATAVPTEQPTGTTPTAVQTTAATAVPTAKSPAPLAGLAIGLGAAALLIRRQNN